MPRRPQPWWRHHRLAALSSAGAPYVQAARVLLDTGIFNAFLTPAATAGQTVARLTCRASRRSRAPSTASLCPPPACGGSTALTPCRFSQIGLRRRRVLNTGRQFYSGFNYLFDPVNGYVGYAPLRFRPGESARPSRPLLALQGNVGWRTASPPTCRPSFLRRPRWRRRPAARRPSTPRSLGLRQQPRGERRLHRAIDLQRRPVDLGRRHAMLALQQRQRSTSVNAGSSTARPRSRSPSLRC